MASDGALFISDDVHGRIWRVTFVGDAANARVAAAGASSATLSVTTSSGTLTSALSGTALVPSLVLDHVNPSASGAGTTTTYRSGLCAYWLATTTANGIIAVHAPRPGKYTLGDFFDIWGQRLSSRNVASVRGRVSATLNGRAWRGNPRGIPLREHASIQLAVGRPVPPPKPIDWSQTGL